MAIGTGLRQGELLALNWSDIDMVSMEINVIKIIKPVKLIEANGSSRHEIKMQTPKSKTCPLCTMNLINSYICLLRKAGIEHKKFHALRHIFAIKLFKKDVPLKTASKLLSC